MSTEIEAGTVEEGAVDTTEHEFSLLRGRGSADEDLLAIHRNVLLSGVVGGLALLLGLAYLVRGGSVLGVLAGLALLAIAGLHVPTLLQAGAPVLVVDRQGVRFRLGLTWRGLPWHDVRQVVVEPSTSPLSEGRLVIVPRDGTAALEGGGVVAQAHLRWNRFWYGAPLGLPLGLTTLVDSDDLAGDLRELAAGRAVVVAPERRSTVEHESEEADRSFLAALADPVQEDDDVPAEEHHDPFADVEVTRPVERAVEDFAVEPVEEPVEEPSLPQAVSPLRDLRHPTRVEVRLEEPAMPSPVVDDGPVHGAAATVAHEPLDELLPVHAPAEPVRADPVIGQKVRHAREMLDMSIDELSQRTRIRPHVLEAIELDDFTPCGGDFYARGHLTAISRSLGLTLDPLLQAYDEHFAQAPINARRVFEAELTTGLSGGMRATLGGPRWSLVIGAVLSLTLVWGLARTFAGEPEKLTSAPTTSQSAGLASNRTPIMSPKMRTTLVTVTATYAATHVVVQDRAGKTLWSGDLALGKRRKVVGLAPFTVAADNAGAVTVAIKGKNLGDLGMAGEAGSKKFG